MHASASDAAARLTDGELGLAENVFIFVFISVPPILDRFKFHVFLGYSTHQKELR